MPIDLAMPVLVVDDSVTTTRIVESYLQQIGFQSVMAVGDGEAALRAIMDRPIALVISDWKMAGMSGLELLHRTRQHPACRGVRFVLMTADANPRLAATVRSMGADGFLTKPFTTETLRLAIEQALASR
jgi:two-component system, chemotaxis family, chemotaxis protein CheY